MFTKYFEKSVIKGVDILIEIYYKRTLSQVFPKLLHIQLVVLYDL